MRCRQFLKALVALVVLLALWRWLQHGRASRAVEETILVMGTVARVVVYGTPRGQALEAALEELKRWDALAGPNGEGSLARINRAAGSTPVRVERSVARLVAGALDVAAETEGAFDPTIGAAVGLWDFREGAVPPDSQALSQALGFLGPGVVRVDTAGRASAVELLKDGVVLDLGGVAKGWAADRAAARAMACGAWGVLVDAGGDLRMMGDRPGAPWRIGVRHPREQGGILTVLEVEGGAVATSGDYERYFEHGGFRYHHLLDPRTGMPARGAVSVTVLCAHAWRADALATALFVMGPERAIAFAARTKGLEALVIDENLEVHTTEGLRGDIDQGFRLAD